MAELLEVVETFNTSSACHHSLEKFLAERAVILNFLRPKEGRYGSSSAGRGQRGEFGQDITAFGNHPRSENRRHDANLMT